MKKLLFLTLILCPFISLATVQDSTQRYILIKSSSRFLSSKVNVEIEFGQAEQNQDTALSKTFDSVVDALNYFGRQGWRVVQAFNVRERNDENVHHYLMEKRISI